MSVKCRYVRPLAVGFVRAHGPYGESSREAWSRLIAWLDSIGARRTVRRGIGYLRDNPGAVGGWSRRYDACVELPPGVTPSLAHGVGRQMLPGGAYAVYRHTGPHEAIGTTFSAMRRDWLARDGLTIDPDRAFMEIYLNDPLVTAAAGLETELCIPVIAGLDQISDANGTQVA